MNVALIGYRGSGKTTVGRKLADRLWQKFYDVDDLIVKNAGQSIREIFEHHGEEHFRDLETAALRQLLQIPDYVLGLGGGTLGREQNRTLLRASARKIFYLRCDPQVLLNRVQNDPNSADTRPNLTTLGGGIDEIRLKLVEREPIYRQVMDAEVDVTNLTPADVVACIARML